MKSFAAIMLLAITLPFGSAQAASATQPTGVWYNPRNNVHLEIQPCGGNLCGTVVWANAHAIDKARRGGTPGLVGKQLFKDLKPQGSGQWSGRVFVPDLARTFSGTIKLAGPNTLLAKGCLIGRILCKSQTWTRIS